MKNIRNYLDEYSAILKDEKKEVEGSNFNSAKIEEINNEIRKLKKLREKFEMDERERLKKIHDTAKDRVRELDSKYKNIVYHFPLRELIDEVLKEKGYTTSDVFIRVFLNPFSIPTKVDTIDEYREKFEEYEMGDEQNNFMIVVSVRDKKSEESILFIKWPTSFDEKQIDGIPLIEHLDVKNINTIGSLNLSSCLEVDDYQNLMVKYPIAYLKEDKYRSRNELLTILSVIEKNSDLVNDEKNNRKKYIRK